MHLTEPLGPTLGRAAHLSRARMEARLSRYEVTPAQTHALLYLHRHGGQAPQFQLTAFLRVKPSTANGIVDRIVEKGLVVRSVSGSDARCRLVTLTDKGQDLQARIHQCFQETEDMMLQGLTPEEAGTLRTLLGRVIQNLEEDELSC